jgi:3-hydroxymyristoyl/3-hydroxydecanoyl-(acyl carrier protein) dehydratase
MTSTSSYDWFHGILGYRTSRLILEPLKDPVSPMRFEHFQMVDQVASFDAVEKRLVAHAEVPSESSILENHFPGYPILPGVLRRWLRPRAF